MDDYDKHAHRACTSDLPVSEVPEEGLMLPACCDTEAWRFTDPATREAMVRVIHDEDCPDV